MLVNTNILTSPANWWRVPLMALLFMLGVYLALGLPSQINRVNSEN